MSGLPDMRQRACHHRTAHEKTWTMTSPSARSRLDKALAAISDPYGEGWMIKMKVDNISEVEALMDGAAYGNLVGA